MSTKNQIDGYSKNIRDILSNTKYSIDYYQREYKWGREQISDLIDDLSVKFENCVDIEAGRKEIQNYPHYFLGSFVLSIKNTKKYVIDGQQRLTSITILLIYLRNIARKNDISITSLDPLIFSEEYGEKSFNLQVEEREEIMRQLYDNEEIHIDENTPLSVQNIYNVYTTIDEIFPDTLIGEDNEVLPFFVDWLINNVDLVEIKAYSDEDAYTIFETMNDRGLSLTATDMLKGYLLSNIKDEEQRDDANNIWKEKLLSLLELSKSEDEEFFKVWIRSNYAESMRPTKMGAVNQDYEKIGNAFHKWVRENNEMVGLNKSHDYFNFIQNAFSYFVEIYKKTQLLKKDFSEDFDSVFYSNYHTFSYQDLLILSSISYSDDPETVNKKIQIVSRFVEMYIVLRLVNYKTIGSSGLRYTMFSLCKVIRANSLQELSDNLKDFIEKMEEDFSGVIHYRLTDGRRNYNFMKFLLSRITHYIESHSGMESSVEEYLSINIKKPYEIEHILANKYERHEEEYQDEKEFSDFRNNIGALVLLPRGYNQSFNDDPYEYKVKHYTSQNLLARSLYGQCYEKNPSFLRFVKESGLNFQDYTDFGKDEIRERGELIKEICERIWNIDILDI